MGFVYSSRLPERFFPGKFDFFGNSHHYLHVASSLGKELGLRVILLSITQAAEQGANRLGEAMADVSLCNTLGFTLVVLLVNAAIAIFGGCFVSGDTTEHQEKR